MIHFTLSTNPFPLTTIISIRPPQPYHPNLTLKESLWIFLMMKHARTNTHWELMTRQLVSFFHSQRRHSLPRASDWAVLAWINVTQLSLFISLWMLRYCFAPGSSYHWQEKETNTHHSQHTHVHKHENRLRSWVESESSSFISSGRLQSCWKNPFSSRISQTFLSLSSW